MNSICRFAAAGAALILSASVFYAVESLPTTDTQLRAMSDELARSKTLHLNDLDKPYFISFASNDAQEDIVNASLGGLIRSESAHVRHPALHVRVGSYAFDNTDSIYSQFRRVGLLPVDDDYGAIRSLLWLSTDALYKSAIDEISRKRNALREMSEPDHAPDFSSAAGVRIVDPLEQLQPLDHAAWNSRVVSISGIFNAHPDVAFSDISLTTVKSNFRLVNTEGSLVRTPQDLVDFRIVARGYAPDGSEVWDGQRLCALHISDLPAERELLATARQTASEIESLEHAPLMDNYTGPVLFEQEAAAQLMAEIMPDAVRLYRKPVAAPGSNQRAPLDGVWATRLGSSVAPDWLTLTDDPTQTEFHGKPLAGAYHADDEGVPGTKVALVEKGVLRNFLLTRQPVGQFTTSNGHGRLPGLYGAQLPVLGNLFVEASQTVPESQMKTKLLEKVKQAGLSYGILVRRLDFPLAGNIRELQGMVHEMQSVGYARTVSPPLLAYRVYPGGREELVRGALFGEFSAKNLRDLALASAQPYVLNFVNNGTALGVPGPTDATTSSVISPSLLFDGVELARAQSEQSKPPLVPAPALVSQ